MKQKLRAGDLVAVRLPGGLFGALRILHVYTAPDVLSGLPLVRVYKYCEARLPALSDLRNMEVLTPFDVLSADELENGEWPVVGNTPIEEDKVELPTWLWGTDWLIKGGNVIRLKPGEYVQYEDKLPRMGIGYSYALRCTILQHFGMDPPPLQRVNPRDKVSFFRNGMPIDVAAEAEELIASGVKASELEERLLQAFAEELEDEEDGPSVRVAIAFLVREAGRSPSAELLEQVKRDLDSGELIVGFEDPTLIKHRKKELQRIKAAIFTSGKGKKRDPRNRD